MTGVEIVNGYEVDTLARSLFDTRKKVEIGSGYCTDEEWARHAQQFAGTHQMLMDEARRIAMEDE